MHDLSNKLHETALKQGVMSNDLAHLLAMFAEHKNAVVVFIEETRSTLTEIKTQTTKTNGRVDRHDDSFVVSNREIRDIKETLSKALWVGVGLNTSIIAGVVIYWATQQR